MATLNRYDKLRNNFNRTKILVIEDNDDQWFLYQKALMHCLPEVTCVRASTAAIALDLLHEWTTEEWELPKLILQDLYLPTRQEGWELVKQIKEMPPVCNHIPLVMISSSTDPVDVRESYQSGISSYIVKPLDFSGWLTYFRQLRVYWWETVSLPPIQISF